MPVVYLPWRRHLTVRRAERRFPTIPSTIPADAQTRQSSIASDLLHILTSTDTPPVWLSCYPTCTGERYPLKAEGSGSKSCASMVYKPSFHVPGSSTFPPEARHISIALTLKTMIKL
jgi:hypothetical protein